MSYGYDFDKWTWLNVRPTLKRNRLAWVFYTLLRGLLQPILLRICDKFDWIYKQGFLHSSDSDGLDQWGVHYDVKRVSGELDELYKYRIILKKNIMRGQVTFKLKKEAVLAILKAYTGVDATVEMVNFYGNTMEIGEPIGTGIASLEYDLFRYRVYISGIVLTEAVVEIIKDLLSFTNVGGNIWEIWVSRSFPPAPVNGGEEEWDFPITKEYTGGDLFVYKVYS